MVKLRYIGRLFSDIAELARQNRNYWLLPLVVGLLLAGLLMTTGQAAVPFLYTLF